MANNNNNNNDQTRQAHPEDMKWKKKFLFKSSCVCVFWMANYFVFFLFSSSSKWNLAGLPQKEKEKEKKTWFFFLQMNINVIYIYKDKSGQKEQEKKP